MEPTATRLLNAIRDTLLARIAPKLSDRESLELVAAMDFALCELLHRNSDRSDLEAKTGAHFQQLLREGATLAGPTPPTVSSEHAASEAYAIANAQLAELIPSVMAERGANSEAWIR